MQTTTQTATTTSVSRLLRTGAAGAAVATVVNASIYGIGRAANISYFVAQGGHAAQRVELVHVVTLSIIGFAIGLLAATIATAFRRPSLRAMQIVGAVVAVLSIEMDFTVHATAGTRATLAVMHVVVGLAYVAALQVARSPRTDYFVTMPRTYAA